MTDSHSKDPLPTSRSSNAWRISLGFSLLLLAISMTLFVATLVQRLSANAEVERGLKAHLVDYWRRDTWSGTRLGKWLPKTWLPEGPIIGLIWGCHQITPTNAIPLTDRDLLWLTSFHSLESLSLCGTYLSDNALNRILQAHPNLRSLTIDGFSPDCLAAIGELENLESLTICGPWDCHVECQSESRAKPLGSPWLANLQKWRMRRYPKYMTLVVNTCEAELVFGRRLEVYRRWEMLVRDQGSKADMFSG